MGRCLKVEHASKERSNLIQLVSVNVATPSVLGRVNGEPVWSGIRKSPVDTANSLWLSEINLSGDGQADLQVHGGLDKAAYAYPSEHFAGWSLELGESLGAAPFGENLSTLGVLEQEARIGDVWEWGTAVLQVTQLRWPCYKLGLYRGRSDVQKRMLSSGRTGWYLRVLRPGEVPASGPLVVAARDPQRVTVRDAHLAMRDAALRQPDLVHSVMEHPALAEQWRAPPAARLGRHRR